MMKKPIINTSQKTQKYLELKPRDFNVFVQFGKAKKKKPRPRVTVNYLNGLRNTRNKVTQHQLLQQAGIKKPRFMRTATEAGAFLRENPDAIIVAKRVNHSRGRGMYRINGLEAFNSRSLNPIVFDQEQYYFEEYVDCNREWRIHVSQYQDNEVIAYRKCLRQEYVDEWRESEEVDKPWIRNMDTCYYKLDSNGDKQPWWDDMVAECKRAIEVLGMDIAGIDIGENTKVEGGDFYIYEVNSACGMEENTREHYEQAIETIIDAKARKKNLI